MPLGNVTAQGWLKLQFERNKAGMGGHLDELEQEMIAKPYIDRDETVLDAVQCGLLWFVENWAGDQKTTYVGSTLMESMIIVYMKTGDEKLYNWCLDYIKWLDTHDKFSPWHGIIPTRFT